MMKKRTPDWYLNAAKERMGIKSDRQLGPALEQSENWASQVRTGRALPGDDTMKKLAAMASVDEYVALLDLNIWRTTGETREAYRAILAKITAAMMAGVIALAPAQAKAAKKGGSLETSTYSGIYIITSDFIRRLPEMVGHALENLKSLFTRPRFNVPAYGV